MKRAVLSFAIAAIAVVPSAARADEATTDPEELLRQGVELRKRHENEAALAEFQRAFALQASPIARAQIGLAEQALSRWIDAERDVDAAIAASDDAWIAAHAPALRDALTTIRTHLGWLEVHVAPEGSEALFDGKPLASGPQRVEAGVGNLRVSAPGYVPDLRRVDVGPGAHVAIDVALVALPAAPSPVPSAEPPPRRRSLVAPIALGAAGVVGIGIGAYFGVRTIADKSDRDAHCGALGCDPTGLSDDASARHEATASTIAFAAGGACVVGAVAWWLLGRDRAPRVGLVPMIDRGAGGIMLRGAL